VTCAFRTMRDSQFTTLWRAFMAQFFTSETVTSDVELQRSMLWVLAFLLPPGLFLMVELFPAFDVTVIVARKLGRPWIVDDFLARMAFTLVTFSMVTIGFIAVWMWDALSFDRRDAMVLGSLPVRRATISGAKLAAVATLLLGSSATVNLFTAVPFALATSDLFGIRTFARHLVAHLTATMTAATFVFAAIVTLRGILALVGRSRAVPRVGTLLQCGFAALLLCFLVLVPAAVHRIGTTSFYTDWAGQAPTGWFLGLFEHLRGSSRGEFGPLAGRAALATLTAVISAVFVSVVGFQRQLRLATTPQATAGSLGSAYLTRLLARWFAGRDARAHATVDFILLTLWRSRTQQAPIALNAAIGLAIAFAAVSGSLGDFTSLLRLRTAVLWIPLLLAYWTVIGLRASFFVPSELPAGWTFRANAPEDARAYWSAVRASMIAMVVPPTLALTMLVVVPLGGWRNAAWCALVTAAMVTLLIQMASLTVDSIPFTQPYRPGHARLKTRWFLYLVGVYAFAYWPARLEMRWHDKPDMLLTLTSSVFVIVAALEVVGRKKAGRWAWGAEAEEQGAVYGLLC
jgi:hypothetical protein